MKGLTKTIDIKDKIYTLRGVQIMFDRNLAELYEVETRVLNQAVKRNVERFPTRFRFQLTKDELNSLRSQIVTLEIGKGRHQKYLPYAFTEQGIFFEGQIFDAYKFVLNFGASLKDFGKRWFGFSKFEYNAFPLIDRLQIDTCEK